MTSLRKALDLGRNQPALAQGAFPCYEKNEQALALRVADPQGNRWIFPWTHFLYAKFITTHGGDELLLTFESHEVHLFGTNLDPLVEAVTQLALVDANIVPDAYRDVENAEPSITRIEVVAANQTGSENQLCDCTSKLKDS